MLASRAATGMLEVLAISTVRYIKRVAGPGVDELRKFHEHVGHFIAPFPATHVNHDIGVGPLGQGLLGHRFAGAESPPPSRKVSYHQAVLLVRQKLS